MKKLSRWWSSLDLLDIFTPIGENCLWIILWLLKLTWKVIAINRCQLLCHFYCLCVCDYLMQMRICWMVWQERKTGMDVLISSINSWCVIQISSFSSPLNIAAQRSDGNSHDPLFCKHKCVILSHSSIFSFKFFLSFIFVWNNKRILHGTHIERRDMKRAIASCWFTFRLFLCHFLTLICCCCCWMVGLLCQANDSFK